MTDDDALELAIQALERLRGRAPGIDAQIADLRALRAGPAVAHGEASNAANHRSVAAGSITNSVVVTGHVEGGMYLGPRPRDAHEALTAYRKVLVSTARHLPLRGIDLGAADPSTQQRFELAAVYIDLQAASSSVVDSRVQSGHLRLLSQELGALDLVIASRRVVLLGDPGSGKSTFVNHLLLCLAAHGLEPNAGWSERLPGWPADEANIVPVPILLRDFARSLPRETTTRAGNPLLLWRFIAQWLADRKLESAEEAIHDALESGRAIVLLDGLDEIPTAADRSRVRDIADAFARRYPEARMLATCRTLSYQDPAWQLAGVVSAQLLRFNQARIHRFIDAWYAELRRMAMVRPDEAARLAKALQAAVDRQDLARLAPNPLLLTVMALVHTHKGRLPDARARLYEDTVDLLLWRWDELRTAESGTLGLRHLLREASCQDVDLHRALWQLAHEAHAQGATAGEALADIGEHRLEVALAQLHPGKSRDWAMRVIEVIKLRAGLLLERAPGVYTFPHRTFQEYLAGAYLAARANFATETSQLDITQWREVILLAVGRLVYVNLEVDRPLLLAYALCGTHAVVDQAHCRRVMFAAEVLGEIGIERVQQTTQGVEILERVRQRLLVFMASHALPVSVRIDAGQWLAHVGDPRFDDRAWWLPRDARLGFMDITKSRDTSALQLRSLGQQLHQLAGRRDENVDTAIDTFCDQIGALPFRTELEEDPFTSGRRIAPTRTFIASFPVTVAQYDAYLVDTGQPARGASRGKAHYPVVEITFQEALGYCRWLTAKLRHSSLLAPEVKGLLDDGGRLLPCSWIEWAIAAFLENASFLRDRRVWRELVRTSPHPGDAPVGFSEHFDLAFHNAFSDTGHFLRIDRGHQILMCGATREAAAGAPSKVGLRLALTDERWIEPETAPSDPTPARMALRRR